MANTDGMYYITGDTLDECAKEIEREHGPDGFTIKTREKIKIGAFLGFGGHQGWRVGYTIRPRTAANPFPTLQSLYQPKVPVTEEEWQRAKSEILKNSNIEQVAPKKSEPAAVIPGSKPFGSESAEEQQPSVDTQEIMKALDALRGDLQSLAGAGEHASEHPTIVKLRSLLEENEFSGAYTRHLIDRVKKEFHVEDLENYGRIEQALVRWITESIVIDRAELTSRPQIIVLVGPTGVGKTTTVAKIASHYAYPASGHPLNVRMVGTDGYRIQAYEQLKHYADILDIPVEKVWDNSLTDKIAGYGKNWDVILIDTIGFSPRDVEGIGNMRKRLELQKAVPQVYLTMAATTKMSDMREIMTQFDEFKYNSLIVTKLDETSCVGNLLSVLWEKQKSVAYITNGQKVPRDFARATQVEFLKRLNGFTIDWLSMNETDANV